MTPVQKAKYVADLTAALALAKALSVDAAPSPVPAPPAPVPPPPAPVPAPAPTPVPAPPPGSTTLILGTDVISGAVSGGENGKGVYLNIFGTNLCAKFSDLGTTTKVYIGGVEVDNYRCLVMAAGYGMAGTWHNVQRIGVQVGALAGLLPGIAYPIDIRTAGVSTPVNVRAGGSCLDLDGAPLTFIVQPGPIFFVSVNGNDANDGSIGSPKRHLQTWSGKGDLGGVLKCSGSGGGVNATNTVVPGTTVYLLDDGVFTDFISGSGTLGARWASLWQVTGTAPNGSTNRGPITISAYPGPIGANKPHLPFWDGAAGSEGGIHGTDSARSVAATPWGIAGFGKYINVVNLKLRSNPKAPADGAPINLQNRGDGWRVVNNDISWQMTGSPAQAAGIANSGVGVKRLFNHIHDVYGDDGFENHGIYIGAGGGNNEQDSVNAFNVIRNITRGSGIQLHSGSGDGGKFYERISIHHNWIQNCGKHGVNLNTSTRSATVWDNVIVDTQQIPMYMGTGDVNAPNGVVWENNTVIGWATGPGAGAYAAFWNNGSGFTGSGSVLVQGNVCYQRAGVPSGYSFASTNGANIKFNDNAWFDAGGNLKSKPSSDTAGVYAEPKFTSLAALNLTPAAGSPLLNAGPGAAIALNVRDALLAVRTRAKPSIGAFEG